MDYYLRPINLNDIGEELYDLANVFTKNKQEYTVEQEIILRKAIMANCNNVCKIYLCFERASNKLVGMIKLLLEPKLHNGGAYVGHIEDVAVFPEYQRKGIGKMMNGLRNIYTYLGSIRTFICIMDYMLSMFGLCAVGL